MGPFVGAAILQSFGVPAVYLVAAVFMATGVALVGREIRGRRAGGYVARPRRATTRGAVPSGAALNPS